MPPRAFAARAEDAPEASPRPRLPGERGGGPARPGRSFMPLEIDPEGGQVLGMVVTPSFQAVALADNGNTTIASAEIRLDSIEDPDLVVRHLAREGRRLIGAHLDDRSRLFGGVLAITAVVDPVRGHVVDAPYLGWGSYPLRARLADLLDPPMAVRPMTATIALSEFLFGKARGRNNVLTLACGLGVAAAVILDGRIIQKGRYPFGAIGGTSAIAEDGTAATLDELASGLGVLRHLHGDDMMPGRASLPRMARALREAIETDRAGDDPVVGAEFARAGRELGRTVIQFGRFIVPDLVLIAGSLSRSPRFVSAARETVTEGLAPSSLAVVGDVATGSVSLCAASCAMAIHEHLLERS